MKLKSAVLTLTLGLVAGLFACQDQNVVAPDDAVSPDDLVATFAKPACDDPELSWPKCEPVDPPPPTDDPTLEMTGVMTGYWDSGVTWSVKKERLGIHTERDVYLGQPVTGSYSEFDWDVCRTNNPGARADELLGILKTDGFAGKLVNVYVDMTTVLEDGGLDEEGGESSENRIFTLVEGEVVRYFWVGPWYTFKGEGDTDGTISNWSDADGVLEYDLNAEVIGVRDTEGPKTHTQVVCKLPGDSKVHVKLIR